MAQYTIGIEFGKTGCRSILADIADGHEVACATAEYPTGVMTKNFFTGQPLPNNWAIAKPGDYIDVIADTVNELTENVQISDIIGIGLAFSSCCILPVKSDGTPLCYLPQFKNNPHAYIKVTRHRSALSQAKHIAELSALTDEPWVKFSRNCASPEWLLPKVLETLEEAPDVYAAADYFMEATDWLIWQLTGNPVRNSFSTSFKAQISESGEPSDSFLEKLNPHLKGLYKTKLNLPIASPVTCAGGVTPAMAALLGVKPGTPVAVGGVDVLTCIPAVKMYKPGGLVNIMGNTSILVTLSEKATLLDGITRGVKGSIIPGLYTYKSNQPCMGDNYAWFLASYLSPQYHTAAKAEGRNLHSYVAQLMMKLAPGENGIIAVNWHRGSNTPVNDKKLSSVFVGMDINTKPEHLYRAIIEGMAFDTRVIIDEYRRGGIEINQFCGVGNIAERNPFIMQVYADILNMPVSVSGTSKSSALGAAIIASVIGGGYKSLDEASENMGKIKDKKYLPNSEAVKVYDRMYEEYKHLCRLFALENSDIMHNLKDIKADACNNKNN